MSEGVVAAVLDPLKEDEKKDGEKKDGTETVQFKDFFWDQFVKYISSAILALTLLITVEFFRNGGVACFHPPDTVSLLPSLPGMDALAVYEFARDQATFINKYCVGSIPLTEFFPLYIIIHGLLLVSPHYIWAAIHRGDFESFFSIAGKIDRLRDSKTGEYSEENFDRVKKLEKEYGGSNTKIFISYVGKLCLQLAVCILSIGVSAGWLRDFSFSFECPRMLEEQGVIPAEWPLNVTVPCVYTSLRILSIVRVADFILTSLAAVLIIYGLVWCAVRHTQQLGSCQVAKFSFQSGLKPETHVPPPILHLKGSKYLSIIRKNYDANFFVRVLLWLFTRHKLLVRVRNSFFPRIGNDLDLFVLFLFRPDASHGKVFKSLQIQSELNQLIGRDHQLLHLYINIQQDIMNKGTKSEGNDQNGGHPRGEESQTSSLRRRRHNEILEDLKNSFTSDGSVRQVPRCLRGFIMCCGNCFTKKKKVPTATLR